MSDLPVPTNPPLSSPTRALSRTVKGNSYTSHSGAHQLNRVHWTEEREEGEEEGGGAPLSSLGHTRQLAMVLFPISS